MKATLANIAAIVFSVVFLIMTYVMYRNVGAEELAWTRRVYLYGAIEAIAFAAVGYLFGKEVNRQRAESAEEEAEENKAAAQGGQQLAQSIRTLKAQEGQGLLATSAGKNLDFLASEADRLFPQR